jgi:diaminopimelate decarboxylase
MTSHVAPLAAELLKRNFGGEAEMAIGGVAVSELARTYGTPLYVYDAEIARRSFRALSSAVSGFAEVFYSAKANPNPAIARIFVEEGAGLEIASANEFRVAVEAGAAPERILFAGPGKGEAELEFTLANGVGEIHVESYEEIELIGSLARKLGKRVSVGIRVNPIAAAQGGAMRMGGKPAAFGFDEETLENVVTAIARQPEVNIVGVHLFAGTQILDADTLLLQWGHGLELAARLADMIARPLQTIDLGGGLGIAYHGADRGIDLEKVAAGVPALVVKKNAHALLRDARVVLEPGRYLIGEAGVYLMAVRAVKTSRGARFVIADGGMHHHLAASGNLGQVMKRDYPIIAAQKMQAPTEDVATLVGPLCTPLDTLGRQTALPALTAGDLVAVMQSGAYGLTASPTNFLSHPRPAEVLVDNGAHRAI